MSARTDVLFIDPPWEISSSRNFWKNIGSCLPSLGIAYIAAYLEKHGYTAQIVDCTAMRYGLRDLERLFASMEPPRYVGFTATSPLIDTVYKIAPVCRKYFPGAKIIAGGVHPTVMPAEVLAHPDIDIVVRGEGEETMRAIVSGQDIATIAGASYKKDGALRHNPDRPLLADLDDIPPPAYHLLPMEKYFPALGSYRQLPAMSIFATRGCPGACTFCYRTFYGKVRKRSAGNIMREVELLHGRYGIREIAFYDDTFTCFPKVIFEFCDLLKQKKLKLTWSCFTRVDAVNEELLKAMKDAGCHLILFGVETADEEIQRTINKRINLRKAAAAVACARKTGINTRASFMIGNPGETEESVRKTIEFAFELDPDQVHFNIATAYPGTQLYRWAREKGYLLDVPWEGCNMSDINMRLPTISPERLRYYYRLVHRKYYFRPRIMFRRFLQVRSHLQLVEEVRGFLALTRVFY